MTELEQDVKEMKESVKRIERALGIGSVTPASVVDINRRAMRTAEKIKERLNGGSSKGK